MTFSGADFLGVLRVKAPRKAVSENVICLCRLLNILAEEQSDQGPHCLEK